MILQIKNVSRIFSDGTKALDDVSFEINEGDFAVIAGSNGSGKTVLMNLIAGLDSATDGEIHVQEGYEAGLVFQDADSQILGMSPFEDVLFGARHSGLKKDEARVAAEKALNEVGLLEKKELNARTLSGGEKRRLAVAGILAINRKLIIFDEPFANLDWPGVKQVLSIMQKLKDEKKTVIVLTHEIEKVLALSNRFIILDKGKIQFDGNAEDGLKIPLEEYGIKNPLNSYQSLRD
ncbi:MAG: ABC transporter ATP-binding protein, partial [Treponema sp.]|nr:ABC transporter ATP-binding protein [Treponema sp.]